ncbi:hypothetical protein BAE44_0023118 [Dichanthelium oligosanthes]|uniref:SUI1 domain-containing protein n=1 Tax=Dichanthelium oligosanthes TaxID=888268 RepID=A0A1E5USM0_9POAL|nr:hypothetical protein BAE44_0023118 [Dichanthelium oligosanthes]
MVSGGKATKGRAPSKDRYLLPAGKKHTKREDEKAKPEADDQFMPGAAAAGVGELLLTSFDPFADAERGYDEDGGAPATPRDDVRELCCSGIVVENEDLGNVIQLQGDHRKVVAAFLVKAGIVTKANRELCCSGIVVENEDLGNVIQLQGDHRKVVAAFLVKAGIVTKANVKIHSSNKITELIKRTKLKKRASVR